MRLFVRDLAGRSHGVDVDAYANVASLKQWVSAEQGVPVDEQQILFGGVPLTGEQVLGECGVSDGSTLFISLELAGGAKKRKKKTYTKPKKIKHKAKKVKLAVLKFYKVDGDQKVSRLRKECPDEGCGPGVFMAMHFNRYYCGKCGLTYVIKKNEDK
eukprot:NODE_9563_length_1414_cov_7.710179.p1 GENE.NODE_9563_length_1414_cov_7.710179~~NODE_9563_length_1414_cov_7.710179.p1  ORF type:complete len:157 (+),score=36.72 NODE_9563_length_1414_cov_7.710179:632-1102(+)